MSKNLTRIAGIAGILSVVLMVGIFMTLGSEGTPGTFAKALMLGSLILGIVFVVGLYYFYRLEAATLSLVALVVSVLGYLLFLINAKAFLSYDYSSLPIIIADILVYVVGVPLFSLLALQTHKMNRPVAITGFLAGLAGLVIYILSFGFGADAAHPEASLAGLANIVYYLYFLLAFGWVLWTGIILLRQKPKPA